MDVIAMNNRKDRKYKSFSLHVRDDNGEGDAANCPAFDPKMALYEDKEQQWRYYFDEHLEEIEGLIDGKKDILYVDLSWMEEMMPSFVKGMMFNEATKGGYAYIGNKTLRTLSFGERTLPQGTHIRFTDDPDLDKVAKKVREDELKTGTALLLSPEPLVKINKALESRICHDNILKNVVFMVGISAYGQNPLNLFLEGPSSTGKTYVVTETLKYFPQEDVWYLGGISATALVHDRGEMEELDGEMFKVVDLSRKILIFLEKPNIATLKKLLPILSHDKDEIEYRITDKNAKGQHATMKVIIRGFPAVIFCTTESETLKDLSTRNMLYAPEISADKINDVIKLQMDEATEPWVLQTEERDIREQVQEAIKLIRENFSTAEVVIPRIETVKVETGTNSRIMRDNKKRLELIKSCARLHVLQRLCLEYENDGDGHKLVMATFFDVLVGLYLYDEMAVSTTTGLAPVVIDFFNKVLKPFKSLGACNYKEMQNRHKEVYKQLIGIDTVRKFRIDPLEQAGYVTASSDETDKRFKYFSIAQDIPTPEITGKKRIIEIGDVSEFEKGEIWVKKALKISEVKVIAYSGEYSSTNPSDFRRDSGAIHNYLYAPSAIRYFQSLFSQFRELSEGEINRIFKTPLKSGNLEEVVSKVRPGVSIGAGVGYEKMGGDVQ
jgi:hypothetical protein